MCLIHTQKSSISKANKYQCILSENQNFTAIEKFFILSDNISRLSVLALIYRAIPPSSGSSSTFIPDCIETARAALEAHQNCMNMLTESDEVLKCSYMHWYVPLLPPPAFQERQLISKGQSSMPPSSHS